MKTAQRKAKGREFQSLVAEMLAVGLGLTIRAEPPTKPGTRANGAVYVPEGDHADLHVRRMGQPGADVALLSDKARRLIAIEDFELHIECKKNAKEVDLGWKFWRGGGCNAFLSKAMNQANDGAHRASVRAAVGLVAFAGNNWPPMVMLPFLTVAMQKSLATSMYLVRPQPIMTLETFIDYLTFRAPLDASEAS